MSKSDGGYSQDYIGGRGFHGQDIYGMTLGDVVRSHGVHTSSGSLPGTRATIANMWANASGTREAMLHGATTAYDWRTFRPTDPLRTGNKKEKIQRQDKGDEDQGRPEHEYPSEFGPPTNQSHSAADDAKPEWSILPADRAKTGMGEDSPIYSVAGQARGFGTDRTAMPRESSALPAWAPKTGMAADSPIYSAGAEVKGYGNDYTPSYAEQGGANVWDPSMPLHGPGRPIDIPPNVGAQFAAPNQSGTVRRNGGVDPTAPLFADTGPSDMYHAPKRMGAAN